MIRTLCLLATLAAPVFLFAQGTVPAGPGNNTVVMPGTNIYVVGGGLYGTGVYVVPGGAAVAPGTLAPDTQAGISLAGRTGISLNQPMQLGVQSTLAPSWPVTAYAAYNAGPAAGVYGAPEAAGTESVTPSVASLTKDFGPSYAAVGEPQPSAASLGEVSVYYKAHQQKNIRTYTNADAQHFTNKVIIPHAKTGGPPGATSPPPPTAPPPR